MRQFAGSRQQPGGKRGKTRGLRGVLRPLFCYLPAAVCLLLFAIASTGCGKKGPPLAPFPDLPAAVTDLAAKRVGPQAVFQFTVPVTNIDGRRPADLARIDLYAHPTRLLQPIDYLKRGTLVGSVKVKRPVSAEESPPSAPQASGVEQGAVAAIVDTPDFSAAPPAPATKPVVVDPDDAPLFPDGGGPLLSPRRSTFPTRFYVAVGVNWRGRQGSPSPVVELPLIPSPAAPEEVRVTYNEKAITISWTPPSTPLRQPIQESTPKEGALASRPVVSFTSSAGYNVYEVPPATDARESAQADPLPSPLNSAPLTNPTFENARVEFGVKRCFVVRTRETLGSTVVESAASEPACVMPADTFAPAAPQRLTAVGSEGAIDLLWNANTEADLGGYLVLRGEAPGDTLQALTAAPIPGNTYRDTTVKSGIAYVYAVIAVDKANNSSAQSNRVEERAR